MLNRRTLFGAAAALAIMATGAVAQDKMYIPLIS